jgi:hypothetical protein
MFLKRTYQMHRLTAFILFSVLNSLLLLPNSIRAEEVDRGFTFSPRLQIAYFEIQKLKIERARTFLAQEKAIDPTNGALLYLENYADMYYLLISEDKAAYNALLKQEDIRLEQLEAMSGDSPYPRLFQAEIRLHWAFAKLKFGNEVSACWDIIKAYRLLEENRKKFPSFIPTLKSLGLLHVLIGSVPEQYTWVTKVLGLSGSIEGGLKELRLVQAKDPFYEQEAGLIYLLLHAYTLQLSPGQIQQLKKLPADQPDNLLLHFFSTSVLMKEGRSEEAYAILKKAPRTSEYIPFPFLDYLNAEILLQKGQYEKAFEYYSLFQRNFKGFNFLKDSHFKQFLCWWLAGRDTEARKYITRVGQVGKTIVESDQYADRFAQAYLARQVKDEQKILFEARYQSDGGYLSNAWKELESYSESSFTTIANRAEFNYRRGRILQKMGQTQQALPYFERSILLTQNTNYYFGPSSALQVGYIYKDLNKNGLAISYFKKAMSYKKHEYKNSIDNKARAALSELGV